MKTLPSLFQTHKLTLVLLGVLIIFLLVGYLAYQRFFSTKNIMPLEEISLSFDPEGPYALLLPRRDGNAINLNIRRVSAYEEISYELAYQSQGIDRGVQGTINTNDKKSEYMQEILFGTCSKGDTFSTLHCVFDKEVENGTLILRIKKDNKIYKMITTWHLQKPDIALGKLSSGDNHFRYTISSDASKSSGDSDLSIVGFSIINDLTGVPKLPNGKKVLGKVYSLNVPLAKMLPAGELEIELIESPPADAKIAHYIEAKNEWQVLDTKVIDNKLTAKAAGAGIFAVLVNSE